MIERENSIGRAGRDVAFVTVDVELLASDVAGSERACSADRPRWQVTELVTECFKIGRKTKNCRKSCREKNS